MQNQFSFCIVLFFALSITVCFSVPIKREAGSQIARHPDIFGGGRGPFDRRMLYGQKQQNAKTEYINWWKVASTLLPHVAPIIGDAINGNGNGDETAKTEERAKEQFWSSILPIAAPYIFDAIDNLVNGEERVTMEGLPEEAKTQLFGTAALLAAPFIFDALGSLFSGQQTAQLQTEDIDYLNFFRDFLGNIGNGEPNARVTSGPAVVQEGAKEQRHFPIDYDQLLHRLSLPAGQMKNYNQKVILANRVAEN